MKPPAFNYLRRQRNSLFGHKSMSMHVFLCVRGWTQEDSKDVSQNSISKRWRMSFFRRISGIFEIEVSRGRSAFSGLGLPFSGGLFYFPAIRLEFRNIFDECLSNLRFDLEMQNRNLRGKIQTTRGKSKIPPPPAVKIGEERANS